MECEGLLRPRRPLLPYTSKWQQGAHAVHNKAIPTWVEDLAYGLGDVAVVLEVLGQRGVVAGQVSEVVHQVKDAGRVRTSSSQEGRSAGRTHCLLQWDSRELH